jgi:hypothetical protein
MQFQYPISTSVPALGSDTVERPTTPPRTGDDYKKMNPPHEKPQPFL